MENDANKNWNLACYLGLILIIVGYVSFSNHREIGNLVTVIGSLIIIFNKTLKHRKNKVKADRI